MPSGVYNHQIRIITFFCIALFIVVYLLGNIYLDFFDKFNPETDVCNNPKEMNEGGYFNWETVQELGGETNFIKNYNSKYKTQLIECKQNQLYNEYALWCTYCEKGDWRPKTKYEPRDKCYQDMGVGIYSKHEVPCEDKKINATSYTLNATIMDNTTNISELLAPNPQFIPNISFFGIYNGSLRDVPENEKIPDNYKKVKIYETNCVYIGFYSCNYTYPVDCAKPDYCYNYSREVWMPK